MLTSFSFCFHLTFKIFIYSKFWFPARFSASSRAEIAKKLQNFTSDLLKLKSIDFESIELRGASDEIGLESCFGQNLCAGEYEACSENDQSMIGLVTKQEICVENGKRSVKENHFSVNSSEFRFNESATINMHRTEIVHIQSPAKFYIKKQNYEINQMELNKCGEMSTIVPELDSNTVYLAQKSNDNNWYRTKVCAKWSENEYLMAFIDYGFRHVARKNK